MSEGNTSSYTGELTFDNNSHLISGDSSRVKKKKNVGPLQIESELNSGKTIQLLLGNKRVFHMNAE